MPEIVHLHEIFYSIQGEGFHSGTPAIFIRATGCNLACSFCDTDFSPRLRLGIDAICSAIAPFPSRFVVLTGGEPTLQAEALTGLTRRLRKDGYFVTLETNGTSLETLEVDWVTVSPKLMAGGEWALRRGQELKLVYHGQDLAPFEDSDFEHYYLQPMELRTGRFGRGERDEAATREQWRLCVEAVLARPRWKLSFQLHKELGVA